MPALLYGPPVTHQTYPVADTERLSQYVRARRERQLGLTRDQVTARGGPSPATQRNIEGNLKPDHDYGPKVLVKLARALEWTDESLERIQRGDQPEERPKSVAQDEPADEWDIVVRVKPSRKLAETERELVEADMIASAKRALHQLEG